MNSDLKGRHALVTGGGSGVGAAVARALAENGASVTVCGRRKEPLAVLADEYELIFAHPCDVTDEQSVSALYDTAQGERGQFDIVVANAGLAESMPAHRQSLALWNKIISVNLTGSFLTVQPALQHLRKQDYGRIIFISSIAGLKGYGYVSAYVSAKHGVVGLMRALAAEYAETGMTVNAVCPGYTDTEMLTQAIDTIREKTGMNADEAKSWLTGTNPQKRFIDPQEVADAVLYLCSEGARSYTGQTLALSGGETS
ncbi:MAG: SDR family oxidoreductase [Stappiaceae bacterium]